MTGATSSLLPLHSPSFGFGRDLLASPPITSRATTSSNQTAVDADSSTATHARSLSHAHSPVPLLHPAMYSWLDHAHAEPAFRSHVIAGSPSGSPIMSSQLVHPMLHRHPHHQQHRSTSSLDSTFFAAAAPVGSPAHFLFTPLLPSPRSSRTAATIGAATSPTRITDLLARHSSSIAMYDHRRRASISESPLASPAVSPAASPLLPPAAFSRHAQTHARASPTRVMQLLQRADSQLRSIDRETEGDGIAAARAAQATAHASASAHRPRSDEAASDFHLAITPFVHAPSIPSLPPRDDHGGVVDTAAATGTATFAQRLAAVAASIAHERDEQPATQTG